MFINQEGKVDHFRKMLKKVKGDILRTIDILKEISESEYVDLFMYIEKKDYLFDMVRQNNIPIKFLNSNTKSLIGEAYIKKEPLQSKHLSYDERFNVPLDNPYKIPMTSQILIPILKDNKILGIIRFSKNQYFSNETYNSLLELKEDFTPLFSKESFKERINISEMHFDLDGTKVNKMLSTLKKYTEELRNHVKDIEMKKIFIRMEDELDSIYKYLDLDTTSDDDSKKQNKKEDKGILPPDETTTKDSSESSSGDVRILIADDVHINVKILQAILSTAPIKLEILSAFDGLETEEVIKKSRQDGNEIKIILLDHHMPGKLGLEIAKDLRKYESEHHTNRAFVISITNDPAALTADKNLYDYHVAKPFSKKDINDVINHIKESMTREARD